MKPDDNHPGYQAAGELFGRLRGLLPYGELTMSTRTRGRCGGVCYRWDWAIGDDPWFEELYVSFYNLLNYESTEAFAVALIDRWKRDYEAAAKQSSRPTT